MKAIALAVSCFVLAACSSQGRNQDTEQTPATSGDGKPFQEQLEQPLHVGWLDLSVAEGPGPGSISCEKTGLRQIPLLGTDLEITIDGLADDWQPVREFAKLNAVTTSYRIKASRDEGGLYLSGGNFFADTDSLIFQGFGSEDGESSIALESKFTLSRSGNRLFLEIDGESRQILDRQLAEFIQADDFTEIYLSNVLLDRVLFSKVWSIGWVKPSLPVGSPLLMQGEAPAGDGLSLNRCYLETASSSHLFLQVLGFGSLPEEYRNAIANSVAQLIDQSQIADVFELTVAIANNSASVDLGSGIVRLPPAAVFSASIQLSLAKQFSQQLISERYPISAAASLTTATSLALIQVRKSQGNYQFATMLKDLIAAHQPSDLELLGIFFALRFDSAAIFNTISECWGRDRDAPLDELCLSTKLSTDLVDFNLFTAWREGEAQIPGHEYTRLFDSDADGLIFEIEKALATDDWSIDSDFDGWSDLAEYALDYDARAKTVAPNRLVVDGLIGDWLSLIPAHVLLDRDSQAVTCPLDINYYNALQFGGAILVAAELSRESQSQDLSWEIVVNTTDKTYTATAREGERFYRVEGLSSQVTPYHNNAKSFELVLPLAAAETVTGVQIQVFQGESYCDSSSWFVPRKVKKEI